MREVRPPMEKEIFRSERNRSIPDGIKAYSLMTANEEILLRQIVQILMYIPVNEQERRARMTVLAEVSRAAFRMWDRGEFPEELNPENYNECGYWTGDSINWHLSNNLMWFQDLADHLYKKQRNPMEDRKREYQKLFEGGGR